MVSWWHAVAVAAPLAALAALVWLADVSALVAVVATPRHQRLAVRLVVLRGLVRKRWTVRHEVGPPGERPHGKRSKAGGSRARGRSRGAVTVGPVLRYLLGPPWRVGLGRLRARVLLGTGDPAATAIACGAAHALAGTALVALGAWVRHEGGPPRLEVLPDYTTPRASLRAGCILRTRLGHLIVALALGWWAARRRAGTPGR